jgi:hypothetical protein
MSDIQEMIHTQTMNSYEKGQQEERKRINKLIETMPWNVYWSVASDGSIVERPTAKVIDRQEALRLINGEN